MKTILAIILSLCALVLQPGGSPLPQASRVGKSVCFDPGTHFRDIEKKQHNTVSEPSGATKAFYITNNMLSAHYWTVKPFFISLFGKDSHSEMSKTFDFVAVGKRNSRGNSISNCVI